MILIFHSEYITGEKTFKLFKAPRGYQYKIHDISCVYASGSSGFIFVLDQGRHEITDFSIVGLSDSNALCVFVPNSSLPIVNRYSFDGLVKTRFLTIVVGPDTDVGAFVNIVFELVKISRNEAILEYLMKSR